MSRVACLENRTKYSCQFQLIVENSKHTSGWKAGGICQTSAGNETPAQCGRCPSFALQYQSCVEYQREIASQDQEGVLDTDDLLVVVKNYSYGMKDRNPCDHFRFFSKDKPNKPYLIRRQDLSGMLPGSFQVLQPLRWCCVECAIHHERNVREEQHHTYMWREQAIIEWSWHVDSIVACCHSAKLCAHAARAFPIASPASPQVPSPQVPDWLSSTGRFQTTFVNETNFISWSLKTETTLAVRDVGVGANFWGRKGFLHEFHQTCPKKFLATFCVKFFSWGCMSDYPQKTSSRDFGRRHFFQIKARWAPYLPRFPQILPGFSGIFPGFSPSKNFWGCACTNAPYTTGFCIPNKDLPHTRLIQYSRLRFYGTHCGC